MRLKLSLLCRLNSNFLHSRQGSSIRTRPGFSGVLWSLSNQDICDLVQSGHFFCFSFQVHFGGKSWYGLALAGVSGIKESKACGVVLDYPCAKAFRAVAESFQVVNGLLLITATLLQDMPTTSCNLAAMACGLQLLISIILVDQTVCFLIGLVMFFNLTNLDTNWWSPFWVKILLCDLWYFSILTW